MVQEAAVSPEVWVVYGAEILQWERFSDAIDRCAYLWNDIAQRPGFQIQTTEPLADTTPTTSITRLRQALAKGNTTPSLLDLLIRFRRCGCMYSEERVFALHGLCGAAEKSANKPILNIGPINAFKRFVLSYIDLHKDLNVLCACLEIARLERATVRVPIEGMNVDPDDKRWARMEFLPNMPSWVPNFSSYRVEWQLGPRQVTLGTGDYGPLKPIFNASQGCPRSMPDTREARRSNVLTVVGVEIESSA